MPAPAHIPLPTLVHCPHPLLAQSGRRVLQSPLEEGDTLLLWLLRAGLDPRPLQCVVLVNAKPIPPECWASYGLRARDMVVVRAVVRDLGGGDGGSNPVAMVLQIALTPGLGFASLSWSSILGGVVSMAGGLLINALFPAPSVSPALAQAQRRYEQASPTYGISGSSNAARPFQPMSLLFGRHRIYPDAGGKPYTEFEGEDQYLYQIFHFGLSDVVLSDWRIGDTPLDNYDGVTLQESSADGVITLVHGNVDTVSGGQLTAAAGWISRTSSENTLRLALDISGALFAVDETTGATIANSVTLELQYRPVGGGEGDWLSLATSQLRSDFTHYWSRGAWQDQYNYDTGAYDTVWAQSAYGSTAAADHTDGEDAGGGEIWRWRPYTEVADAYAGGPWPSPVNYTAVPQAILSSSSRKTFRRTFTAEVVPGQYEVRVRRVGADDNGSTRYSEMSWAVLRSYQPDTASYAGQKRVGLKIKASGQLNGQVDTFNALGSARERVRQPDASWALQESANPAWQFLRVARGQVDAGGRRMYGALLADSRIELEGLYAWAEWCRQKGLRCDFVHDQARNTDELLHLIARCGRAVPTWRTGKLGAVWDAENQTPVQVFGMANIRRGTFRVEYQSRTVSDEIVLTFINPDLGYKPDTVRVTVPGVTAPVNPAYIEIAGIADKALAGQEANLQAFRQAHFKRRIGWESDIEGLMANRGDVVYLSHDLTQWGYSGRLVAASGLTLTLSRPVPFTAGQDHYIGIRWPDGVMHILQVITGSGEQETITLLDGWPAGRTPPGDDTDNQVMDYLWWFEPLATPGRKVKIVDVAPLSANHVRLTAVDEMPEYYSAAANPYTYITPPTSSLAARVENMRAAEQLLDLAGNVRVHLAWDAINATGTRLRVSLNGAAASDYGVTFAATLDVDARGGDSLRVEYAPVALAGLAAHAAPKVFEYSVQGLDGTPADVTGFVVSRADGLLGFRWQPVADLDLAHYALRRGAAWASAVPLGTTTDTRYSLSTALGGTYLIKAVDTGGRESINAAAITTDDLGGINIVVTHDEGAAGWPGTVVDMTADASGVALAGLLAWNALTGAWNSYGQSWWMTTGIQSSGTYTTSSVDLGAVLTSRIELDAVVEQVPLGDAWVNWDQPWTSYGTGWIWGGPNGIVSAGFEIDTSADGIAWDGWRPFTPGDYTARYLRFRVSVSTSDTRYNGRITRLAVTADVPDREILFEDQIIASGGTTLSFSPAFLVPPVVTVAIQDGAAGDTYKITAKSTAGMTVQCFDSTHNAVARNCDIRARAY